MPPPAGGPSASLVLPPPQRHGAPELVAPPSPGEDALGPEERLHRLEHMVAARSAALRRLPLSAPVPAEVLALLTAPPVPLTGIPPKDIPRVVALLDELQELIEDLALRQRALAGRLAAVRSARRGAGPPVHLLDCST